MHAQNLQEIYYVCNPVYRMPYIIVYTQIYSECSSVYTNTVCMLFYVCTDILCSILYPEIYAVYGSVHVHIFRMELCVRKHIP